MARHTGGTVVADPTNLDRDVEKGDAALVERFTADSLPGIQRPPVGPPLGAGGLRGLIASRSLATALWLALAAPTWAQAPSESAAGRGDRLMAEDRTEAAIAAYTDGLAARPDDPELLWKAARAISNLADETAGERGDEARLEEAVTLARRAVRAGPRVSRAHTTLAAALGKLALFRGGKRKVELAREVGREARRGAELDPGDFAPFTVLGVLERELATLNPLLRGFAAVLFGGVPDASLERSAAYLERAVRLAPDYVAPRLELARTYRELDREAAARAELEVALAVEPRERLDRLLQDQARDLLDELR